MEEKQKGIVIWFNNSLGYGFLKPDEGGEDLFCHWSSVITEKGTYKTLTAGQKVSYTVGANNTGPQAENIVVLEDAPVLEQ